MLDLKDIRQILKNVRINFRSRDNTYIKYHLEFYTYLGEISNDEKLLNKLWCLKSIFIIQNKYVESFLKMKNEQYYPAWCLLYEIEVIYNSLRKVYYNSEYDEFFIDFIYKYAKKFQKFFPYNLFLSPEFHVKKYRCNICGRSYSFKKNCEHEVGKLYNGKMCSRIIEDCEITSISIVKNPVQKYSVIFSKDYDYNYDLIKSHISNLDSPFHKWDLEIFEKLEPHSSFRDMDKKDKCPCKSGKGYENCCLKKEGVLIPYYNVNYERLPSSGKFENYVKV